MTNSGLRRSRMVIGGVKWQELQLVGSLVGLSFAMAASPPADIEDRIEANADAIFNASKTQWKRIAKTQTKTQWDYIARIATELVGFLGIDPRRGLGRCSEPVRFLGGLSRSGP